MADRWELWLQAARERAAQLEQQPRRVLRSSAHRQPLPAAAPAWYEGKPVQSSSLNPVSASPMLMYSHGGNTDRGRKRTPRVINREPEGLPASEAPAPVVSRKFVKRKANL